MKNNQLETLEKINKERKLDKKTKEKIQKKVLKNFILATVILLFFIALKLMAINLDKNISILIYKISSIILLIITLILFETAYKKDSNTLAITSIEILLVTITALLTPYILISKNSIFSSIIGVYFAIYYVIKNFMIYKKEKNKYLKEKNDIDQIVKKESQDELAQEQLEIIKKESIEKPKRKRGRPKKENKETPEKEKDEQPKRKRGRPPKNK